MNKEKDLLDFKNLLHRLEIEGEEFSKEDDVLMGIVSPEKFPYKTRSIVQELVNIIDDNPEFSKMIPDKLKKFFSGYKFSEGVKMTKAKRLISMMERDPKFKPRGNVQFYRVEGLMNGKWSFIFRTSDLIIADTAADEYRDQYDAVRVMKENPDGSSSPIKGREYEQS